MRRTIITCLLLCGFASAFAQKVNPEIKDGTTILLTAYVQGSEVPVYLTVDKVVNAPAIKWSVDGYGDGVIQLSEKGMNEGTTFFTGQPATGTTNLADTETWAVLSRAAFKSLAANKSFDYNGMKFKVKEFAPAFKLDGKEVDAFTVTSDSGGLTLCILNNPSFPLILQTTGMPMDTIVQVIK